MTKNIIASSAAPAAIGPYSQAVQSGDLLFLSGQIPLDPVTMQLAGADITKQTEQVLQNIGAILKAANCDYSDIVKSTIYLIDLADFTIVNDIYARAQGRKGTSPPAPPK